MEYFVVVKVLILSFWTTCSTDKMSEAAILEVLRKNFKDHLILGEEGGLIGDTSSDYLWCIDPLGLVLSTLWLFWMTIVGYIDFFQVQLSRTLVSWHDVSLILRFNCVTV